MAISVSLALGSLFLSPTSGAAGLQSKMDSVFNEMSNVSRPGVFETQRRGVLSGGSYYVRNPIMNTELVSLQMPSFKAGCGGIDLFGGSFSFINADQFIQLLRTIASNAKGYAFQIALDIACPSCMQWINNAQATIQKLNQMFGNSCQLAQGIVSDVATAMGSKRDYQYSLKSNLEGLKDDFFSSWSQYDGTDTKKDVDAHASEATKQKLMGNLVWKSLYDAHVKAWIVDSGSEKEEYELLMSFSGTIIIPKSEEDPTNSGNTTNPKFYAPTLSFRDLVEGGTVNVYNCRDDQCMKVDMKKIHIVGMAKRIYELLTGENSSGTPVSPGIITKFTMLSGNGFTKAESNLMSNMPSAIGALVRNLSVASSDVAKQQANDISYAIAMSWANRLMLDNFKMIRQSLNNSDFPESKTMIGSLSQEELRLAEAYNSLSKEHATLEKVIAHYQDLQTMINKVTVSIKTQFNPSFSN